MSGGSCLCPKVLGSPHLGPRQEGPSPEGELPGLRSRWEQHPRVASAHPSQWLCMGRRLTTVSRGRAGSVGPGEGGPTDSRGLKIQKKLGFKHVPSLFQPSSLSET